MERDYTDIFFSYSSECPSNYNFDGCVANDSGKCSIEYCPFIFWLKIQKEEI